MLQKNVANTGLIQIELIGQGQTYHIIGILYNASLVTVFDRVTLESQQMPQRNHFSPHRAGRGRHSLGRELRKGVIAYQHLIER